MAEPDKQTASCKTDADIIAQCKKGNKHAYRMLVEKYKDVVYTTVLRYTRDPSDAEEITQETFLKAWQALNKFEGRSKFSTWVMAIAINRSKDVLKKKKRLPYVDNNDGIKRANSSSNTTDGPETTIINNELGIRLKRLMDELPAIYREAFVLRHVEELSYEEISGILKIRIDAVKMRVFRAREILKQRLYKEDQDG